MAFTYIAAMTTENESGDILSANLFPAQLVKEKY